MCQGHPSDPMDRRAFFRVAAAGTALLWGPDRLAAWTVGDTVADLTPLEAALAAHRWIQAHAVEASGGLTWPVAPARSGAGTLDLYHGAPGVVLFLSELHHATGDADVLDEAVAGADALLASLQVGEPEGHGLYTGVAGVAYALERAHRISGHARFRDGAVQAVDRIVTSARPHLGGVAWDAEDPASASSDIVSGAAGIGLTLLWAAEALDHREALATAHAAGRRLAAVAERAPGGLLWLPSPGFTRNYPNFSHGTAGVATFLARVGARTGDRALVAAAEEGAGYLQAIARCDPGGCAAFHHAPGGEELFYLSWCHGPPGTARLFHELAGATGDEAWAAWPARGARAVRDFGVPERRSPGYWNNVSQCCGDAGVGEFFLALDALDADPEALDFARRVARWIVGQASEEDGGRAWVQAENRVSPEDVVAQTGWMQGAAGVGAFLLHLDGRERGRAPLVSLPDAPWLRGA